MNQPPVTAGAENHQMSIPRIAVGLELVDDSGDEVSVSRINTGSGIVTLKMLDEDDSYTMSLRELRSNLRDGVFAVLESEGDDDDEEDGDDDDEDADEDAEEEDDN
jgi:hypothetical protein